MNVLVVNSGSSSLKFQLIESSLAQIELDQDRVLARGCIERIGGQALITWERNGEPASKETVPVRDHRQAIEKAVHWATEGQALQVDAVGHRVVHGGEAFQQSVLIDAQVVRGIEDCIELAPLHNPANLRGIRAAQQLFGGDLPQVAVFDTAFHSTMPAVNYLYGIPYSMYRRHKIRRYGFHGTSHRYVAYRYRRHLGLPKEQVQLISLHLGNGCSACAIAEGQSRNTSMGMTPLEGLLMGTRCGDIDPTLIEVLMQNEGLSIMEVDSLLNKQSGLLGISGLTADMRDLLLERDENQDRRASLAIDMFCARVKHYVGAYLAELNGAEALVFTGGIGQNSAPIRSQILSQLSWLGVEVDPAANLAASGQELTAIHAPNSRLQVYVIATNEELLIARDTVRAIVAKKGPRP
jgi:acetate kinase